MREEQNDDDFDYFDIDPHRLDIEINLQPKKFREAARSLARAKKKMREADSYLDLVKADVAKRVRDQPLKFGIEKATVDAVKEAVILSKDYQEANKRYIQAEYLVDMLGAEVETLRQRKTGVEISLELYKMDFFAEPKMPRDSGDSEDRNKMARMQARATFSRKRE